LAQIWNPETGEQLAVTDGRGVRRLTSMDPGIAQRHVAERRHARARPISLIITALAADAIVDVKDAAGQAVKDAYVG